jgi:hypothetical protein
MFYYVIYPILFVLTFFCFWIPIKSGNKNTGKTVGIFLLIIIFLDIITSLDFLSLILYLFFISFSIIFITYWTLSYFKLKKTGIILTSILTVGLITLCLSPWISDWAFNQKDAKEILSQHGIELYDKIELLSNESGGFMDYYHIFEIKLSESDYQNVKNIITHDKNYIGDLEYNWWDKRPELRKLDTLNYENEYNYVRDYNEQGKMEDGTFHFVFELSKSDKTLKYIGSNE